MLSAVVQGRLLVGSDEAILQANVRVHSSLLDAWAAVSAIALSAEFSVLYALVAVFLLWRLGLGFWSFAPLAFILSTVVELALKTVLQQPPVPLGLHRPASYPLISVNLAGSFPSGHANRAAFFCLFGAVLLWYRGGLGCRIGAVAAGILVFPIAYSRVYMGYHWTSDVVAGLLLGAAVAMLVAPPVARRLFR